MKIRNAVITCVALSAFAISPWATAQSYTVKALGPSDAAWVYAAAINNNGQVVGEYDGLPFITGANGVGWTNLSTLGVETDPQGINNSGQVVGQYATATYGVRSFITAANGVGISEIPSLQGIFSRGIAINDSGQVTGFYASGPSQTLHAFITGPSGLGLTDLGTFGGISSSGVDINSNGQVLAQYDIDRHNNRRSVITGPNGVGYTELAPEAIGFALNDSGQVVGRLREDPESGDYQAFITGVNGAGLTIIDTLVGGSFTLARDINASGQVVGQVHFDGVPHAFVTGANGVGMIDLNSFAGFSNGDYFEEAWGINDAGQILVQSLFGHAYLLTPTNPVPEPETYAMMLAGLGLLGVMTRRRKQA